MQNNPVTIVTAFFDIKRAERGDGRTIDEYKDWIKKTLQLNCNLYIVTEPKFYEFFVLNRPAHYSTYIKTIDFKECHYFKYYNAIKQILDDPAYKEKVAFPDRVECKLPEYNIIQYSKFHYLKMAMEENHFSSEYFFWMDAGCSRFFLDVDVRASYPGNNTINALSTIGDRFIIQKRQDLETYPIDDDFIWNAANLLYGTMFGGNKTIINKISELVEKVFIEKMLNKQNVNNEQLALAMVWKENPDLFLLTDNNRFVHLILFKILSM